jgi:RimJ/RimL family protein N-acetyltransferase
MWMQLAQCVLRSWRIGDARSIVKHLNNRNVSITLTDRVPYPYTMQDAEEFLMHQTSAVPETSFAIDVQGEAIGAVGFRQLDPDNRYAAEVGYWVGEAYWGRGIATEVLRAVTAHLFADFDFVRIQAHVFEGNTASMRVLEKCGYLREGILRKSASKNGRILDQALYSILRRGY